jgi:hypothetical protein
MRIFSIQACVDVILAKIAREPRSPRRRLIMSSHIIESLGDLGSLAILARRSYDRCLNEAILS